MIVAKELEVIEQGETLFEKVSVVIRTGERIAMIGSDATSVTTFLRILAGEAEMDVGTVKTEGERVAYISSEILQSGGDALAKVLHSRPTFLIIDSGTVSLSTERIDAAVRFIQSFRGGMLIASPDVELMKAAKISRIFELQAATKTIASYTGTFDWYLVEKEKNDARANEAYEKQQREKRRLEGWLDQKRKEASVDRSPEKGATIRAKAKYLKREILDKEIPKPPSAE